MRLTFRLVNWTIKNILQVLCRIDQAALARVPQQGPLILVANHINFLEVPVLFTFLQPRAVTGFAKAETWQNPLLRRLFDLWGGIPLRRGEADVRAFRLAEQALAAGKILAMAPEGTRSGDGQLRRGLPGVVMLALHSGAPLMPVVYYGGERFRRNIARLARTDFHVVVGNAFHVEPQGAVNARTRQQIVDEIMYQLAALLPPAYRGYYADLSHASEVYLRFAPGVTSNLQRA